jgi:hypothetical protein
MHIQGYPAKDKSHKNPVRRSFAGYFCAIYNGIFIISRKSLLQNPHRIKTSILEILIGQFDKNGFF